MRGEERFVDRDQVLTILGELIEICQDSERDHRLAASCTVEENLGLTAHFLFHDYALQRAQFVRKLQEEMRFLGYTPLNETHQPVLEASDCNEASSLSKQALLDECRRVEAMAEKRYESALRSGLPTYLHEIIKNQYMHIREARHRIHKLEPDMVAAP
jgi:uncharacterized protein (TIGR02284 family)